MKETSQGILIPPPGPPAADTHQNGIAKLNGTFADSAFSDNKQRPIHRWVPWIAGFSAEFVRDSFARYLPANPAGTAVVLDPFYGVGTTLIEAMRCGHDATGFEVNPYPALAARAKCEAAALSPSQVNTYVRKFEEYMLRPVGDGECVAAPEHFRSRIPFFGPHAQVKVLKALGFIRRLPVRPIQDLFSIAFGSVMVSLSNYSYEPSLGTRPAAGKPTQDDAPVVESIVAKLPAMKSDVAWLRQELGRFARRPQGRVIPDNFLNALEHLQPASVDLLVTSPPYLNNYHYVRNTRPQLFWLGFVSKPGELKSLENQNSGKYWQTVRDLERVPLHFDHPGLDSAGSLQIQGASDVPGLAQQDLVIVITRAAAPFQVLHDSQSSRLCLPWATPIEGLASVSESELLSALRGLHPSEHPGRFLIVGMRRQPQALGVLHGLLHQLPSATRFDGDHREARQVVIPDARAVVLPIAVLIESQLRPETEDVHQEDAGLDALPLGLEAGDNHPAKTLAEKVRWPESFMR